MKTMKFLVSTNPAAFGSDASPQEMQEYAAFAHQYLLKQGYDQVEIEFVMDYPKGDDPQAALRKEIWSAYKGI